MSKHWFSLSDDETYVTPMKPIRTSLPGYGLTRRGYSDDYEERQEAFFKKVRARKDMEELLRSAPQRMDEFRDTFLAKHQSGAMACNRCHYTPYECVYCSGDRCRCVVEGVYRHWKDGEAMPLASEAFLLKGGA